MTVGYLKCLRPRSVEFRLLDMYGVMIKNR